MSSRLRTSVLIVGAGPAGSSAAGVLAEAGVDVITLEAKSLPGLKTACSGILGPLAWEVLPIRRQDWVVGRIEWARFISPLGSRLEVEGRGLARVVDREALNRDLARRAEDAGAVLLTGSKLIGLSPGLAVAKRGGARLEVRFDYLISADGANSTVRGILGLSNPGIELGVNVRCSDGDMDGYEVRLRGGSRFSWIHPGPGGLMAGALGRLGDPVVDWAKSHARCPRGEVRGGLIPRRPLRRLVVRFGDSWVVLVGDAAGQVKPLSRGGIYWGVSAARMAAEAILDELDGRGSVMAYQRRWWGKFKREVALSLSARSYLERLSPRGIEKLFQLLKGREEILRESFHVDLQGGAAAKLLSPAVAASLVAISPTAAASAVARLITELVGW